jgi:ribosomal protein S18 acetylase RimI-like enzyme
MTPTAGLQLPPIPGLMTRPFRDRSDFGPLAELAWLDHISVRRPWRRRGLARALIVSALQGLREGGIDEAMLGVDGENPTDALGLYESLGFVVKDRGSTWRKAW